MKRQGLAAAGLMLIAGSLYAEEPIATDRPDFVESSMVVGKGHWQLETSGAFEQDRSEGVYTKTWTTPSLLRVGLGSVLEARLEWDGYTRMTSEDVTSRGFSDMAFGVKWHSMDGAGLRPSMAWLLHVDAATGSEAFRGHGSRPSLRVVGEWELPWDMAAGVMPGIGMESDDNQDRYVYGIIAGTVAKSWTEKFRTFMEISGQELAHQDHGGCVVTGDYGMAYIVTPDWQLDAAMSHGLTKESPDLSGTVGVSRRF